MKKHQLILAITALAAAVAALPAKAADGPTPRIMVSGEGEAWAAPDMALINLTVLRDAPTSREALDANTMAMTEVMAAMKAFGIEDRDLQTSGFSIQPRYQYPDPNKNETFQPKIVGYTVVNTLGVRVRDLKKVGEVLDQSVTLGVNQGGDVTFLKGDSTYVLEEARKRAVKNAVAKAKTITSTAGVGTGRILEMSEQSFQPGPIPMMRAEMQMAKMAGDAAPVPVAAGENSYRVTVNVTFEIRQ
jgi:uncharacterized protein YggE